MTLVRLPIPPTIFMLLRDLDLIKVKLLEEVEGPYKHKCDVLAQVRYAPVLPSAAHAYLVWGILKEQHIGAFQKSISKEHLGHFKRAAHWGISKEHLGHFKRAFGAFQKSSTLGHFKRAAWPRVSFSLGHAALRMLEQYLWMSSANGLIAVAGGRDGPAKLCATAA